MGNKKIALLITILLILDTLLVSLACTDSPPTHTPMVKPPYHPIPVGNNPPKPPCPCPCPYPPSPPSETCPMDALKLSACVDLLGGLVHVRIGKQAKAVCCPLIDGLVGLDAAICFCTAIKLKLLDINVDIPVALRVIRACGKTPPRRFKCPN